MQFSRKPRGSGHSYKHPFDRRVLVLIGLIVIAYGAVAARLFTLQVLSHKAYAALAANQHGFIESLFPERGDIYLNDPKSEDGRFPAAINKTLSVIFADTRLVKEPAEVAKTLAPLLEVDELELFERLSKKNDPYEPLKRKATDELVDKVKALDLPGIAFAPERFRFYPEASVGHITGFVGSNAEGKQIGRYGIEGYMEEELAGRPGKIAAEKTSVGGIIGAGGGEFTPARDGDEVVLTIDRNIQYVACEKLRLAVARHGAASGSVVVLDPKTGAVLAMCSVPNYDPNEFAKVEDPSLFNNPAIFAPYEPGSIFKPITMAAAIDAGKIGPNTTYVDEGSVKIGPYTIKNSDGEAHGLKTMAQVLEESLNTGTIFAQRQAGADKFRETVRAFGFGERSGIELDTEAAGDISSLDKKGDIWPATASYGQGITVTPLQMASAFGAIANGGILLRAHVVDRIRHADGEETIIEPKEIRQAVSKRTASLVSGMLVRVVESGHGKRAGVPGYFVAGKTGTAQIPKKGGGYDQYAHIGSFAGFAPVDDPAFAMVVRIDRPTDTEWAEASAAPLFGEIAAFLVQYLQVPPTR